MIAKRLLVTGLCLVGLFVSQAAKADDIDEREKTLVGDINTAANNKVITSKDAAALRKQISDFKEKKRTMKAAHGDVTTLDDDRELDKSLNAISQDLETRKSKTGAKPAEKPATKPAKAEKSK
jgi:hypothetical protein